MGIIKGKDLSMAGFSLFRSGNASPAANNLSLLRKISKYLKKNNPVRVGIFENLSKIYDNSFLSEYLGK